MLGWKCKTHSVAEKLAEKIPTALGFGRNAKTTFKFTKQNCASRSSRIVTVDMRKNLEFEINLIWIGVNNKIRVFWFVQFNIYIQSLSYKIFPDFYCPRDFLVEVKNMKCFCDCKYDESRKNVRIEYKWVKAVSSISLNILAANDAMVARG